MIFSCTARAAELCALAVQLGGGVAGVRGQAEQVRAGRASRAAAARTRTAGWPAWTGRRRASAGSLRSPCRSSKSIRPSCACSLDIVTTRGVRPPPSAPSSRPVSAKWPRWLVPNCSSKPSAVSRRGGAITPALLSSRSTGRARRPRTRGSSPGWPCPARRSSKSASGASARMRARAASPRPASRQARIDVGSGAAERERGVVADPAVGAGDDRGAALLAGISAVVQLLMAHPIRNRVRWVQNAFTGAALDRVGDSRRRDLDWLAAQLEHPGARAVVAGDRGLRIAERPAGARPARRAQRRRAAVARPRRRRAGVRRTTRTRRATGACRWSAPAACAASRRRTRPATASACARPRRGSRARTAGSPRTPPRC